MIHQGTKVIETGRLILRKAVIEDAQPMFENWATDPEVTKFLTWPIHSSTEVTKKVLESWVDGYPDAAFYQWMIVLKDLAQPVGTISVVSYDDQAGRMEIGYCIGRPWWHKGIMSEALYAVMEYLFDEVGIVRIEAKHDVNNPRSGAVMQKCGMKYVGIKKEACSNNQGVCDCACYVLMKSERGT